VRVAYPSSKSFPVDEAGIGVAQKIWKKSGRLVALMHSFSALCPHQIRQKCFFEPPYRAWHKALHLTVAKPMPNPLHNLTFRGFISSIPVKQVWTVGPTRRNRKFSLCVVNSVPLNRASALKCCLMTWHRREVSSEPNRCPIEICGKRSSPTWWVWLKHLCGWCTVPSEDPAWAHCARKSLYLRPEHGERSTVQGCWELCTKLPFSEIVFAEL